jgi:ribonuclease-3
LFFADSLRAFFSVDKDLSYAIKNIFGFVPGNIFLYQLAFRHKSVANESIKGHKLSNERLEYLGDAVLSAIVADYLFKKFPYKNEGFLTEMRSKIVSRASLNKLSQKMGVDKLVNFNGDGKSVFKSANGDAFEALIGAIYLDKGFVFTRTIIIKRIIELHLDIDTLQNSDFNFKSKLLEWGQKEKQSVEFAVAGELGEGFKKQYLIQIRVNGEVLGEAKDFSIKGAEQLAAEKTWISLNEVKQEA